MKMWLGRLGFVVTLAVFSRAALIPTTQDTIVVARSDDASTTPVPVVAEVQHGSTEGPLPPLKLTDMDVTSDVTLRYAHTAVVTRVRNPAKKAQEATFRVLLPETAFISGFVMTLDGKPYKAYVKEKEEAKKIYNEAISQGIGAAHVAAKARDSNHFTVSVNVEPQSTAVFNLTYEELLVRRNGVYNHDINLHPGALVPKLTVTVNIRETNKIKQLRVPEVTTGNEIDPSENDPQNSKATITRTHDDRVATITFNPDLNEQKRLMEVYKDKAKASQSHSSNWGYDGSDVSTSDNKEGVLGQFVVQYDVDRPKDGEVLVNDGYFVHFFAPTSLPALSKHVVFVLDTSGSMMDRKIVQLREAMKTILDELNSGDYFNIVEFSSVVKVHDLKEANEPVVVTSNYQFYEDNKPVKLRPPAPATKENIDKAKVVVSRLEAIGGTNINGALNVAMDLINKGVNWTGNAVSSAQIPNYSYSGGVTTEPRDEVFESTTPEVALANDSADKNEVDVHQLEPIVIFLTDGEPTVGETSPRRIINRLTEKNSGPSRASVFSLAFGEDADRGFLRKLSLKNEGFMRHIYEAADAALQLRDFYRQVSSPLLSHVKFIYPEAQVKEDSLTKSKFRSLYLGSEAVVAGRVDDGVEEFTPTVLGFCGVGDTTLGKKKYEIFPKVPKAVNRGVLPLERLWAYLTIKQLLDERDAAEAEDKPANGTDAPAKKALDIALKYSFVTPLTSLVVVKPNDTSAVDAESVDKTGYNEGPGVALSAASFQPGAFAFGSPLGAGGSAGFSVASISNRRPIAPMYHSAPAYNMPSKLMGGLSGPVGVPEDMFQTEEEHFDEMGFLNIRAPLDDSHQNWGLQSLDADFAASTTFAVPTTTPPLPTSSRLTTLHLQEYPWLEPLLKKDSDSIDLQVNGTVVNLKLFADEPPSSLTGEDSNCKTSISGADSVCVYINKCNSARNITTTDYQSAYCSLQGGYAGVCCPKTDDKPVP